MKLSLQRKLGLGALLAIVGALGITVGAFLGWPDLARPWGFLLGFVFGLLAGMGATLAISGLIDRRSER